VPSIEWPKVLHRVAQREPLEHSGDISLPGRRTAIALHLLLKSDE
jgi:hypothetical protein